MASPELLPVPEDAPIAGRQESGVIEGVRRTEPQTTSSTQQPSYQTEFVKVYQDAGVIGVSMLTLLALCFLLGMFSLRLLKMYVSLTESRDKLDEVRNQFSQKLVERLLSLEAKVSSVIIELRSDHGAQDNDLEQIKSSQERIHARLDRFNESTSASGSYGRSPKTLPNSGEA